MAAPAPQGAAGRSGAEGGGCGAGGAGPEAHVAHPSGGGGLAGRVVGVAVHRVVVDVMLKPEILDPQGQAVANALPSLGHAAPAGLRIGRHVVLDLEAADADAAVAQATEIAEKLLANPVIEEYTARLG